ncbi:D-glycero-beta-D-manno-heptose 1-phosphate adenylyltransferase [Saccharothrix coeruleofusca]|uniref:D-glycero-beta-D-manno-heptose 1-phosphate adenylyltransferase n=1 Tax=Saccharothrix coeruleofusca TaxID=33919 RepID=A0A918AR95_9PSEU|nr:D-glycero-beta-D-manno-heptose 1-phosphate adenylyltransferase [Saccharothrix coeruleofusca]MBP2335281.1 rfaE bifunctional protein nucleotidyltransferase chain/domain/rfaE bifunctional protein kinase chain/domain [Saccharothrix coeruleofusca]GGP71952.1 bifunctional protein HldE [Saccharothrix coeruleofusca]
MRLVVVGDSLLDVDVEGNADRLCPDAPAPVLEVEAEHARPGGAALAAALAHADGLEVTLVSAIAEDADGERLRERLADVKGVYGPSPVPTPVKTRLRSGGHSLARVDRGGGPGAPSATDEMLDAVRGADFVLVSDYGRGLVRDRRLRTALRDKPLVWDPHPRGPAPVAGARLVTPNKSEATGLSGCEHPADAAEALRERWSARAVVVTLGAEGALLAGGGAMTAVPAPRIPVVDPCGAGDRFAVTAAARLMAGAATDDAVTDAVLSAAEFLLRGGAGGFAARAEAAERLSTVDAVRARGGTVVATGGCFDLLHAGHVRTLEAARALGDCLVVCLNSDRSVRRLKGPDRPITRESDRVEVLRALACVDEVVVFEEDTPERVLDRLRPDIWVKGGDYRAGSLPEAELVRRWGGRTVVVPYHRGRSTTRLADALSRRG